MLKYDLIDIWRLYEILIKGSLPGGKEILLYNVVSTSGL